MRTDEIQTDQFYWAVDPFDRSTVRVKAIGQSNDISGFWRCHKDDGTHVLLMAEDFISCDE